MSELLSKIGSLGDSREIVKEMRGTDFDALASILSRFVMNSKKAFIIEDDIISQQVFDPFFYVHIDMTDIFQTNGNKQDGNQSTESQNGSASKKLNMKFLLSKKEIETLRKMKQRKHIVIIHDKARSRYLITDGNISQEIEIWTNTLSKAPLYLKNHLFGGAIHDLSLKDIKQYIGKTENIYFMVFKDQVEQLKVRGSEPYTFTVGCFLLLKGNKPDLILKAKQFPKIVGKDNFSLSLAKDSEEHFWLLTESNPMLGVKAQTFERLEKL